MPCAEKLGTGGQNNHDESNPPHFFVKLANAGWGFCGLHPANPDNIWPGAGCYGLAVLFRYIRRQKTDAENPQVNR
jgi:hypothetical protein